MIPSKPRQDHDVVACANTHLCVMVDGDGLASFNHGASWSMPKNIDPPFLGTSSVSCGPGTFCLAVSYDGLAIPYNDP